MGTNSVVSIRVEALGVSIAFRIADGGVAVEQTETEIPAAVAKVKSAAAASREALSEPQESPVQASPVNAAIPASTAVTQVSKDRNSTAPKARDAGAPVIHEPEHASTLTNGPAELQEDSGNGHETQAGHTNHAWSAQEVEKLTALWPTHSASDIAEQLGRGIKSVRNKVQNWV